MSLDIHTVVWYILYKDRIDIVNGVDFVNANDRILRKIKIVKYVVDFTKVIEEFDLKTVLKKGASDYKHLWWYEKELAPIIASNFRCMG